MPLSDFLRSLFGSKPQSTTAGATTQPTPVADSTSEPAQVCNLKALLIVYNPTMDAASGKKMVEYMNWSRPDDLVGGFIGDVLQASGGLVRYQVAKRVELDEFPPLIDGFKYAPSTYLDVMRRGVAAHNPSTIDYNAILNRFNVLSCIADKTYDEVWVMGFPYAGLYESAMGGAGAFWCNAPALNGAASCARRFVVMGFSYERGVGEMLHSYNHRAEAIMAQVFKCQDFLQWAYRPNRSPATISAGQTLNPFQRFALFDQIAPGKAGIGLVHFPPNAARDYDLGNPNPVRSECYDWLNFPNFRGDARMISSTEWGGGDERSFQSWWMRHLPKVAGRQNGVHNNWWQYIANPNNVTV
jgi:hypothetical protein